MLNCENCANEKHKDELLCCVTNHLGEALTELKKQIPVIGRCVKDHECKWFEPKGE